MSLQGQNYHTPSSHLLFLNNVSALCPQRFVAQLTRNFGVWAIFYILQFPFSCICHSASLFKTVVMLLVAVDRTADFDPKITLMSEGAEVPHTVLPIDSVPTVLCKSSSRSSHPLTFGSLSYANVALLHFPGSYHFVLTLGSDKIFLCCHALENILPFTR